MNSKVIDVCEMERRHLDNVCNRPLPSGCSVAGYIMNLFCYWYAIYALLRIQEST
jgi:hypothetical protein